jgi:enoyl-CoA hydratase/carnithine racemase
MVNRVLAPDKPMSFAMEWARTPASRPPRSIGAIKKAIYRRLR